MKNTTTSQKNDAENTKANYGERMTNKRFEVWKTIGSFQCWNIEDTINDKVVCDHIIFKYEADRLCSCLNELHEENQRLIKKVDFLEKIIDGGLE